MDMLSTHRMLLIFLVPARWRQAAKHPHEPAGVVGAGEEGVRESVARGGEGARPVSEGRRGPQLVQGRGAEAPDERLDEVAPVRGGQERVRCPVAEDERASGNTAFRLPVSIISPECVVFLQSLPSFPA